MNTPTTLSKAIDRSLSAETDQDLSTQHVLKKDFDFFNQYLPRWKCNKKSDFIVQI